MKVFIVGGTGLLGYHATLEFLERGHDVDSIALPDIPLGNWFPKDKVRVRYGNVFEMNEEALENLFRGYDAMVYAVGPDDRITPHAPAYKFFHERLVDACGRVVKCARDAAVKRIVICGSYFAYFDRKYPELHLREHHPYVKCRVEQEKLCFDICRNATDIMILELPYIFGTMPERQPIWKDLFIKWFSSMKGLNFFFDGGTVMMSVEKVAECIVGAIEIGEAGKAYQCGDENISWKLWINWIMEAMDIKRKIITVPTFFGTLYGVYLKRKDKRKGRESGFDYVKLFKDILCRKLYYDPSSACEELGVSRGGLKESVITTIKHCL